jgi:serine/threonine protein kinase
MENIDKPRIELLKLIGKGTYGTVWLGRHNKKGSVKYIAVKLENENTSIDSLQKEFLVIKTIG